MTYPHQIMKVTWGGTAYGNEEIWSNSLSLGRPDQDVTLETFNSDDNATDGIVDAIKKFHQTAFLTTGFVNLDWVKFSLLGPDGKYATAEGGDYVFSKLYDFAPITGQGGKSVAPQCSVAITLDTMARRGLAKTGRFYVPASGDVGSNGRITNVNIYVDAAKALINEINTAIANNELGLGTMDQVVVASKEREGAIRFVQAVRVGDVVDTQRKRRNNMKEIYTTADITVKPGSSDDFELAA